MSSEDETNALAYCSVEELVNELKTRFDHAVFIGLVTMTDRDFNVFRDWTGCPFTVAGLAQSIVMAAVSEVRPQSDEDAG